MTERNLKQPYMIYEGPRPPPPAAPEPADAAQDDGAGREAAVEPESGSIFGIGLLVAGALAGGIAIGIWLGPTLQPADAVASLAPPKPLALSVTSPTAERAPAAIYFPPVAAQPALAEQPTVEPVAAPSVSKAPSKAPPARAAPPPHRIKTASIAKNPLRSTPAADRCKASGSRAQMAICADASIAAADRDMRNAFQRALRSGASPAALHAEQVDWLALREDAARRSPSELAAVYEQRIADLNAIAEEPPH